MFSKLPDVGFSLYPEDKVEVAPPPMPRAASMPPPSTFVSEGKVSMPQVVAAPSPFKATPMPSVSFSMQEAARIEEASRTTLFGESQAANTTNRLDALEAQLDRVAEFRAIDKRTSTLQREVEARMTAAEARMTQLSDLYASIDERLRVVEGKLNDAVQVPQIDFPFDLEQIVKQEDMLENMFQNVSLQHAQAAVVEEKSFHDDDEKEKSEVRTISLGKRKLHSSSLSVDKIVHEIRGKTERELNTALKAHELTEMLSAFGETYAPPKIEAVRTLIKCAAEWKSATEAEDP